MNAHDVARATQGLGHCSKEELARQIRRTGRAVGRPSGSIVLEQHGVVVAWMWGHGRARCDPFTHLVEDAASDA